MKSGDKPVLTWVFGRNNIVTKLSRIGDGWPKKEELKV